MCGMVVGCFGHLAFSVAAGFGCGRRRGLSKKEEAKLFPAACAEPSAGAVSVCGEKRANERESQSPTSTRGPNDDETSL